MDAQPDLEKLAGTFASSFTALAAVSREIAHVANLPTFNDGQRLCEAIERLSTSINDLRTDVNVLQTEVRTLRTEVSTLRTEVGTLREEVGTLRIDVNSKFDSLELRMRADSLNHTARLYNSHISSRDTPLRLLHDQHNMAVEGFPRDPASLMRLSGNALTTLLDAFQLPIDGTLESKKRRFREFVGLMVDA